VTRRRLILLRHGKSGYPPGVVDHDRPLADRGRREAALAGAAIADRATVAAVLCSTATRTRETLRYTGIDAPAEFSSSIYEASVPDVLDAIRAVDGDPEVLLVVGHSPGMPATALELADQASDAAAVDAASYRFPTSAFAVLDLHVGWPDLDAGSASLRELVIPR
jgi:phosphohistidine phosphatase